MSTPANEFDAAKSIVETLKGFDKDRAKQEQIIRWVAESLGLTAPMAAIPLAGATSVTPLPPATGGAGASASGGATPPAGATDIKSFVASKQPKSDNQFAAVVAYYHRFAAPAGERLDDIDGEALQDAARKAPWSRFKRPDKTLANAMAMGYLDRSARGRFKINSVGENLVAMALPGTAGTAGGNNRKRPKKANGKGGKKSTSKSR